MGKEQLDLKHSLTVSVLSLVPAKRFLLYFLVQVLLTVDSVLQKAIMSQQDFQLTSQLLFKDTLEATCLKESERTKK